MKTLIPDPVKPGDRLKIVFPSNRWESYAKLLRAIKYLRSLGYDVEVPKLRYYKGGFFAGTDEERANDIMEAFEDDDVRGVLQGIGGVGSIRILDKLNYKTIRKNAKPFIGVSDATPLHLAIHKFAGLATYYGGNAISELSHVGDREGKKYYIDAIEGKLKIIKNPKHSTPVKTLTPGKVQAPIIGGTLTLISTLMGTKYEIDLDGKILFVEDIGVEPEVFVNYFQQLILSGKMKRCKGIIFGEMVRCNPLFDYRFRLQTNNVIKSFAKEMKLPSVYDFAAGHGKHTATLPFGITATFDATKKTVTI